MMLLAKAVMATVQLARLTRAASTTTTRLASRAPTLTKQVKNSSIAVLVLKASRVMTTGVRQIRKSKTTIFIRRQAMATSPLPMAPRTGRPKLKYNRVPALERSLLMDLQA